MTPEMLMRCVDKLKNDNICTAVYVNKTGRKAFCDVGGRSYLIGFVIRACMVDGKFRKAYIGSVSRSLSGRGARDINAIYLELA